MVQLECEMTDGIEDLQNLFEAAEVYDSMPQVWAAIVLSSLYFACLAG